MYTNLYKSNFRQASLYLIFASVVCTYTLPSRIGLYMSSNTSYTSILVHVPQGYVKTF